MTDLSIGGETFNVLIEGDAALPVVMLSHALGADLHLWDDQMSELLKHCRVLRYDTRGHGGNAAETAPFDIARLGRDALAILDALDIDKVHWIGLSKGGVIGQWLMINAPERIERAVLANTMAHGGDPAMWNARILAAKHQGLAALADGTMSRWFSDAFSQAEADRVAASRKTFLATSAESYAAACAALRDVDLREDLRRIDHPVLVIAGRDDASMSPAQTASLVDGIENARLLTLEARHISNIEAADAFNKAVVDFLTAKAVRPSRKPSAKTPLPTARRVAGRRSPATRGSAEGAIRRPAPPAPIKDSKMAKPSVGKATAIKISTKPRAVQKPGVVAPAKAGTASTRVKQAPAKAVASPKAGTLAPPARRGAPTATTNTKAKPKTTTKAKTAPKPIAKSVAPKTAASTKTTRSATTSKAKSPVKAARGPAPKAPPIAKVSTPKTSARKTSARKISARKISAGEVPAGATRAARSPETRKAGATAKTTAKGPSSRTASSSAKSKATPAQSTPAKNKARAPKSANRGSAAKAPATSRRK